MHKFLIAVCALATLFDGVAVMLGLRDILRGQFTLTYVLSTVSALLVVALLIYTRDIWRRSDSVHKYMRVFWCFAFGLNLLGVVETSKMYVIVQTENQPDNIQAAIVCILTFFLTAAPIAVSYLWKSFFDASDDDDDDREPPKKRVKPEPEKITADRN